MVLPQARNLLNANVLSEGLQKVAFWLLKGHLLACKTRPFAMRLTAFCKCGGRAFFHNWAKCPVKLYGERIFSIKFAHAV